MPSNIVICGGGNGAQVLTALAKREPEVQVSILTTAEEVEKLNAALAVSGGIHVTGNDGEDCTLDVKGMPDKVVSDPALVIPTADMIILVLPAFVHEILLKQIAPHLKPGVTIVGMPGQAGFEFVLKEKLGDELYHKISILTLASLPWACRVTEFGKEADIIGTKVKMGGSAVISDSTKSFKPVEVLQKLIGNKPVLDCSNPLMTWSLFNLNAVVHPTVLYGEWVNWDGKPVEKSPLFYQGITEETAGRMESLATEISAISSSLGVKNLPSMLDVYKDFYGSQLKDSSSLFKAITTNTGYVGLTHPVKKTDDGKFVPDFEYRYLTEDIPNGLAVIKGFAEISGVPTPTVDLLLKWSQEKIGKEYITSSGRFDGKDISESRAPQRYGIKTREELMKCY
jgi:hypothetical protein